MGGCGWSAYVLEVVRISVGVIGLLGFWWGGVIFGLDFEGKVGGLGLRINVEE